MAKQFRDPIDDEADAAEGASGHSAKLRERISEAREAAEPNEVVVEEPDDDDEEGEELAEAKASRKDKRAARQSSRERAAAAEARAAVLAEQLEITRRSQANAPAPQREATNPVADIDERIKSTNKRLAALHDEWGRRPSEARAKQIQDEAEQVEIEKITLVHQRVAALEEPMRRREQKAAELRGRAPDVYANPRALEYAEGEFRKRRATGAPDSLDTFDAVMQEAREVVLGVRPKPDAAQRQRAAGIGGGPRTAGSEAAPKISMAKGSQIYRLACAQYPDLEPAQACQKWANKNGKEYLARIAARR